ncbi:MAG TPA: hypothetical protein PLK94_04735 [Alphaproteobacteria bacterium]|nr:hypothetical protein [Alphaproteobacteria bacterium]
MSITTGLGLANRYSILNSSSPLPLRTVVTQNRVQAGTETRGGADSQITRYFVVFGQDCSSICLSLNGWTQSGSGGAGGEINVPNSVHVQKIAVVYNSTNAPATWSGSRTFEITSGAVDQKSDEIPASAFGVSKFTKGDILELRCHTKVDVAGVDVIPYTAAKVNDYTGQTQQTTLFLSTDYTVDNIDGTGVITFTGAGSLQTRSNGFRPMVWGRPLVDQPSFVVVGDSIAESVNDNATYAMGTGLSTDPIRIHGVGYMQRAMRDTSNTTASLKPCLNLARSSAASFHFTGSNVKSKQLYKYARFGIDELGTNDPDNATIQTHVATIWSDMRAAGIEKIIRTDLCVRTTSTDNWTTEANQTYLDARWQSGGEIEDLRTWFDTKLADNTIDYILDTTSVKGTDPFKWKVDGSTANYTAADSTHPSSRGHEFLAIDLRTLLNTIS